ncbi:hypothetical protein HMPREF0970_00275 [Schaalia odontolytica F0309]|uniref:Uncharacterized protein n=1 Tax=Schaalia odontolytica F0309 TaxID=649742 RepID=D4TWG6_9ACTO|nr:hypothetical protein HMPREF0970_00275 [Schaalia odontolytica F0309]
MGVWLVWCGRGRGGQRGDKSGRRAPASLKNEKRIYQCRHKRLWD